MSSATPQEASVSPIRTAHFISAKETVPFVYRAILVSVEPFYAAACALFALRYPDNYIATFTRQPVPIQDEHAFVYKVIGGGSLFFAFIQLFVLHMFDDRRLWRVLCLGMLLRDVPNLFAVVQAVGGWGAYLNIGAWTSNDFLVFFMTVPPLVVRFLLVLGVGVEHPRALATPERKNE